ncbi:nucleotidyltransferase [Forsythia ovata]|uniref:Nucleotidyltransferase n=1 Tax=Forsythia ovata TaxID=205694 RepID=A0ABD1PZ30_9LAMI
MGEHNVLEEPSGSLPNGLLPGMGLVMRSLDNERWSKAEDRTAELIACIQPNQPSEERRNAIADYVQQLIMKCFPCQVCTFGSVPLKTYLPDGDIDLTAFSHNQTLKDTWANQVRDMLQNEEQNENTEFHVKEVQYIQAEVKIIKCLVENIVVDISFNQIGGLCTLCFLDEVDNLIGQNHLFKRSIILIKAWCYYESRILGAHHGLISTYALETLVLYIFHVFNNSFLGPLEVLYRFLEFFSNFDWDNFCVSLWGPVPISSLPDMTAEPPRKDSGELLLSKLFLDACSSVYAVFPGGQENNGQPFVSKYFNVVDPLRVNNNLGRSVSKGNFFRVRSAFGFGAKRLARLLDCPKENIIYEVNQFFTNTWERHGSGHRPDAPGIDLWRLKLSTPDSLHEFENSKNNVSVKKVNDNSSVRKMESERVRTYGVSSQHSNNLAGSVSRTSELSAASQNQSLKSQFGLKSSRGSDQIGRNSASNQDVCNNKLQRDLKPNHLVNGIQGRFLFARTHSSPELTDAQADVSALIPHNRQIESAKVCATSVRLDITNRTKNLESESLASHLGRSSVEDTLATRHAPTHQSPDASVDSKNGSNYFHQDWSDALDDELSSISGTQGMHQDEQDIVNMMASTSIHGINGQGHLPFNLASSHLPFPIPSSFLAPMGYTQQNLPGFVPTDIPSTDPSFSNVQFPHGLVAHQLTPYFPDNGLNSPSADSIERSHGNFGCVEMNSGEAENDFSLELDAGTSGGYDPENGKYEMLETDNKQPAKMSGLKHVPPRIRGSGSSTKVQPKHTKEKCGSMREESDNYPFKDISSIEICAEERSESSRFSSATHGNSLRSRTSLESSSDGSSTELSKSTREKRGKKLSSTDPASGHGKGKNMSEHVPNQAEDDDEEWGPLSNVRTENPESNPESQSVASLHVPRHHMPGFEVAQTSGSDSMFPITPMLIGSGSGENMTDNSGLIAFYPTGPPIPFLTMLTVYNIPPETGTADSSIGHFEGNGSLDNCGSGQNFSPEGFDQSEDLNTSSSLRGTAAIETSDVQKSDILNSDFASHWQNLQFGRFCQNPQYHGPLLHPSPVVVPPVYLQGHFAYDNPDGPLSANMNLFTQLMSSYGHHLIPAAPLQSVSSRPPNVYQHYTNGMPRYRSGTGTYLPNPKFSARERHSSGTRRGSYNYDRNDNNGDREGNPNAHSKSRTMARSYNRNQTEKSYSRSDRVASSESRADRSWRHDPVPSFQSQNGPLRSNFSQNGPPNVAYNMYPFPPMNAVGVSSNAPSEPPVMMLYPFDHNATYGSSHGEQLESGSVGPVGFPGTNEQSQMNEGSRARTFEYRRFHGGSGPRSSPDQPSSPCYQRRV